MKRFRLLTAYIVLTFLLAIPYTVAQANRENAGSVQETGTVNLLRSYWYESFEMRELFRWCVENDIKVYPLIVDKAAFVVYAREYGVKTGYAGPEAVYVLTAYPRVLKNHNATLLYPARPNFMSVYEVQP